MDPSDCHDMLIKKLVCFKEGTDLLSEERLEKAKFFSNGHSN
jgi:hypothetical protein